MRAIILAAGLGTRLAPLSDQCPKALVPVAGAPALDRVLARLAAAGVSAVGVNAHHHAEVLVAHLDRRGADTVPVHAIVEERIQGPVGGIAGFLPWLDEEARGPVLLHNADAATDISLERLLAAHARRVSRAGPGRVAMTMALVPHAPTDSVRVDERGRVLGLARQGDGVHWTYSGVAVLDRPWLERLEPGRPALFVPQVHAAMAAGLEFHGWVAEGAQWHDLGTPAGYLAAHEAILTGLLPSWGAGLPRHATLPGWRVHPSAKLAAEAQLAGWGVLGAESVVAAGANLRNVVVWPRGRIRAGEALTDTVVAPWARVSGGTGAP